MENFSNVMPPFDECIVCPVFKKFGRCPHYSNGVCPLKNRQQLGKIFIPLSKVAEEIKRLKQILINNERSTIVTT